MTIGFHYHVPAQIKTTGEIITVGSQGVFLDSLAQQCDRLICFLHTPSTYSKTELDYKIESKNIIFVDIGGHDSVAKRIKRWKESKKYIIQYINDIDIMLIRGPSPLLPYIAKLAKKHSVPYSLMLVADYLAVLKASKMKLLKKMILKSYFIYNKLLQDFYAKDALIIVNSHLLYKEYEKYNNIKEIKTTTLRDNVLYYNDEKGLHNPVELLFTGRIESQKGLEDIAQAMLILKDKDIDTRLNLIGWETEKNFIEKLKNFLIQNGMDEAVVYHGSKSVGDELFSYYKKFDIYVIASRGNFEGFPRTIWEALANSLPVVSSNVSSIPYYLEDLKDALLFNPYDTQKIAENLEILIQDVALRKKIIKNAFNKVKNNTLENQSKILYEALDLYIKKGI